MIRTYSELKSLKTFRERYEYLKLDGVVGKETFGFDRYLNQKFYKDKTLWKPVRDKIIVRDLGKDLAMDDDMYEIPGIIIVHHMNPVRTNDIIDKTEYLLNPEYLVCVSSMTHNAIHYGDFSQIHYSLPVRSRNDTCPWRKLK